MGETSDANGIQSDNVSVRGVNGKISSRTIYDLSFKSFRSGMTLDKPGKLRTSSELR